MLHGNGLINSRPNWYGGVRDRQWGRGLSTKEIGHADVLPRRIHAASMGPRSFNRGNVPVAHRSAARAQASMGPRSFNRGNFPAWVPTPATRSRFNGAAVFQPRKCAVTRFKCFALKSLQWGRGLSTAEMTRATSLSTPPSLLQWGRGLSTAEMQDPAAVVYSTGGLQWGRGLSTAEIFRPGSRHLRPALASMGPRSFNRGNAARPTGTSAPTSGASMGPRSFNRGNNDEQTSKTADVSHASMGPRSFNRGNKAKA